MHVSINDLKVENDRLRRRLQENHRDGVLAALVFMVYGAVIGVFGTLGVQNLIAYLASH